MKPSFADSPTIERVPENSKRREFPSEGRSPTYSIVVPLYNEEASVGELGSRLTRLMNVLDGPCEAILVDDGSSDQTYPRILALRKTDARFKILSLSRNFGKEVALTAGLDAADGDAVVTLDGDLQHPPELVHEFVSYWKDGYDVVYAVQAARDGQPLFRRVTARAFYALLSIATPFNVVPGEGDFRLMDRQVVEAFRHMRESNRYVRGMWNWIGFNQIAVPYVPPARYAGHSKFNLRKMAGLSIDAFLSSSMLPLRSVLIFGLSISTLAAVAGFATLMLIVFAHSMLPPWVPIICLAVFVVGVQFTVLGVIGEYVGQTHMEAKRRPMYILRSSIGLRVRNASAQAPAVNNGAST